MQQRDEDDISNDNSSDNILMDDIGQLVTPQLGIISNLDGNYPDELIPEFDSDLMNMDVDPESGIIVQHMDICEPLSKLKKLIEQRLGLELPGYTFSLQGMQTLEGHRTLVDQCVQGEGLVQINVQLQTHLKRLNIIDVLKPADDYAEYANNNHVTIDDDESEEEIERKSNVDNKERHVYHWQIDQNYKQEQDRLKIPQNPELWDIVQVKHWVQWAVRQFNLPNLKLSDWSITGNDLMQITLERFKEIVPNDPGDLFWTHLELLRTMKVIAVPTTRFPNENANNEKKPPKLMKQSKMSKITANYASNVKFSDPSPLAVGSKAGNNGQIQLWQFLLELLTSREFKSIIHWLGNDGEFKLNNPEIVAHLWGDRKNKPTMNYEKLSRALRYYYDGDMISKVHGKRFVYKFVCDLKQLLGYSAVELARLVNNGNPRADPYKNYSSTN